VPREATISKDNPLNLDTWRLPGMLEPDGTIDGGDAAANYGTIVYCGLMLPNDINACSSFVGPRAQLRRHPNTAKWYGRAGRMSRDNATPLFIIAASQPDQYRLLWPVLLLNFWHHLGLFAWNIVPNFVYDTPAEHKALSTPDVPYSAWYKLPDLMGPDIWQIVLRGLCLRHKALSVLLRPVLWLCDVYLLLLAVFSLVDSSNDQRNALLKLHFAAKYCPTLLSVSAWKLYKRSNAGSKLAVYFGAAGQPDLLPGLLKLLAD
jgi:hypothetical protein